MLAFIHNLVAGKGQPRCCHSGAVYVIAPEPPYKAPLLRAGKNRRHLTFALIVKMSAEGDASPQGRFENDMDVFSGPLVSIGDRYAEQARKIFKR